MTVVLRNRDGTVKIAPPGHYAFAGCLQFRYDELVRKKHPMGKMVMNVRSWDSAEIVAGTETFINNVMDSFKGLNIHTPESLVAMAGPNHQSSKEFSIG